MWGAAVALPRQNEGMADVWSLEGAARSMVEGGDRNGEGASTGGCCE